MYEHRINRHKFCDLIKQSSHRFHSLSTVFYPRVTRCSQCSVVVRRYYDIVIDFLCSTHVFRRDFLRLMIDCYNMRSVAVARRQNVWRIFLIGVKKINIYTNNGAVIKSIIRCPSYLLCVYTLRSKSFDKSVTHCRQVKSSHSYSNLLSLYNMVLTRRWPRAYRIRPIYRHISRFYRFKGRGGFK